MAIQILGLRTVPKNPHIKSTVFFSNGWRAASVNEIFEKISDIIEKIPTKERHNLYFTVADCFEEDGRVLKEQHVIPFDIDNLAGDTTEDVKHQAMLAAKVACEVLKVNYAQTGVIFSGNGVQFFVQIPKPILSEDYFDTMRAHYKVVCDMIQSALTQQGISGNVDTTVFSKGRLMRLPNTENRKPNKPTRTATILNGIMVPQDLYIDQLSGIDEIEKPEQIHSDIIKAYPEPDAKAVMDGCLFIKHCFDNAKDVLEPQWYAAASIVMRLYKDADKSKELFHKMSEPHPSYNFYETELKAGQALENAGPRTCKNINSLWDGCAKCEHYGGKLISPILIYGEDYIKSKDHGFREIRDGKSGPVPGRPAYGDLEKVFAQEYEFINIIGTRTMYVMDKTHWRRFEQEEIKAWVKGKVQPAAMTNEMQEFYGRITLVNQRREDWVDSSIEGFMNFQNGILNINTGELQNHSPNFGFMHVIPYNYDPRATSPRWDKFMLEITQGDQNLVDIMLEFGGYAVAGGPCTAQKAMLLVGEGANGKSVWADTLAKVVGDRNFSPLFLNDLRNEQMRAQLRHKLFNMCDEGSSSLRESNEFKTIVSGGNVSAKEVYKPTFYFRNTAKLIVLTNNLPTSADTSDGFFRRFIIIPFRRKFKGDNDNKNLNKELWEELPGICNTFVQGYQRLLARKYVFTDSKAVEIEVAKYKQEMNMAGRFASEELEMTPDMEQYETNSDIYARYVSWCMTTSNKPLTDAVFFKDLRRSEIIGDDNFSRASINKRQTRIIRGTKLAEEF